MKSSKFLKLRKKQRLQIAINFPLPRHWKRENIRKALFVLFSHSSFCYEFPCSSITVHSRHGSHILRYSPWSVWPSAVKIQKIQKKLWKYKYSNLNLFSSKQVHLFLHGHENRCHMCLSVNGIEGIRNSSKALQGSSTWWKVGLFLFFFFLIKR